MIIDGTTVAMLRNNSMQRGSHPSPLVAMHYHDNVNRGSNALLEC
jgi:hypothetical protein